MGSSKSYKAGHTGKGQTVPADNSKMGTTDTAKANSRSANPGTHDTGKKKGY